MVANVIKPPPRVSAPVKAATPKKATTSAPAKVLPKQPVQTLGETAPNSTGITRSTFTNPPAVVTKSGNTSPVGNSNNASPPPTTNAGHDIATGSLINTANPGAFSAGDIRANIPAVLAGNGASTPATNATSPASTASSATTAAASVASVTPVQSPSTSAAALSGIDVLNAYIQGQQNQSATDSTNAAASAASTTPSTTATSTSSTGILSGLSSFASSTTGKIVIVGLLIGGGYLWYRSRNTPKKKD